MAEKMVSRSLAQELMHHGMQHFFLGGLVDTIGGIGKGIGGFAGGLPGKIAGGIGSLVGDVAGGILDPVTGLLNKAAGSLATKNPYQAGLAPLASNDYTGVNAAASNNALAGYDQAAKIRQQQQMLAQILGQQVEGGGPNPAQLELAKNTGNNIAAQGALMAGQRGAGANVGLIAKQAAQQGGAIQQQANSDAAILRAKQQLAAQEQLANQQATIGQQNINEQQLNSNLFGASSAAQNAQNHNIVQNYGMQQGINAEVAKQNAASENDLKMGILKGAGSAAAGIAALAEGGEIPEHIHGLAKIEYPEHFSKSSGVVPGSIMGKKTGNSTAHDRVPILASPGEVVLPNSVTQSKNAPSKAAEFMKHIQEKKQKGSKKSYENVAHSKKSLKDRVDSLEKHLAKGGYVQ